MTKQYRIFTDIAYDEWLAKQTKKEQYQVETRISKIEQDGHFGDHHSVSDDDTVWELRWRNGRRVYYAEIPEKNILLLLGGNKNGQGKDITKAQGIFFKKRKTKN